MAGNPFGVAAMRRKGADAYIAAKLEAERLRAENDRLRARVDQLEAREERLINLLKQTAARAQ